MPSKKRHKHNYGKLHTKLVIQHPWETLSIDLIGPYTLKGQDKTEIDFMCLIMINQATRWLKIVELPVAEATVIPLGIWGQKGISTHTTPNNFDNSSVMISTLRFREDSKIEM